jgi:hypothetical protein
MLPQVLTCATLVRDNATVSASAHFNNLQLQKSPSRVFGQNSGNSADISKAFFEMGISKFESSQVSQAVRGPEILPWVMPFARGWVSLCQIVPPPKRFLRRSIHNIPASATFRADVARD